VVEIELKKLHGNKQEVACKNDEAFWMFRQSEKMKIMKGKFYECNQNIGRSFFFWLNSIMLYNGIILMAVD